MSPAQMSGGVRHWVHNSRIGQIVLVAGFWALGEGIVRVTHMPVPGSVIGLGLLFLLLVTGGMKLLSVRRGAQWYLAEMLLFFIPAVLAVLNHSELFGLLGLKILAVIVLGTVIVMVVTALTIELALRMTRSRSTEL